MLKINNNNISFNRGETVALDLAVYSGDGTPFIFPKITSNMQALIAFTVRSSEYNDICIEKYLNMETTISYNGYMDYSIKGYAKFSTQEITECADTAAINAYFGYALADGGGNSIIGSESQKAQRLTVAKNVSDGVFYCWCSNDQAGDAQSDNGRPVVYSFEISIGIDHSDTAALEIKAYSYDMIAYIGENANTTFPLSPIYWKKELITPHTFKMEDSNNA